VQNHLRDTLGSSVRTIASLENPIDLTGSATDDDFIAAVNALSESQAVDCVLVLLLPYSPGVTSDLGARLGQVYQKKRTPLVAYVPHVEKYRMLIEGFELNHVPVSDAILQKK
jgi:acyl-CoA synthetase (NDP forming)